MITLNYNKSFKESILPLYSELLKQKLYPMFSIKYKAKQTLPIIITNEQQEELIKIKQADDVGQVAQLLHKAEQMTSN